MFAKIKFHYNEFEVTPSEFTMQFIISLIPAAARRHKHQAISKSCEQNAVIKSSTSS